MNFDVNMGSGGSVLRINTDCVMVTESVCGIESAITLVSARQHSPITVIFVTICSFPVFFLLVFLYFINWEELKKNVSKVDWISLPDMCVAILIRFGGDR